MAKNKDYLDEILKEDGNKEIKSTQLTFPKYLQAQREVSDMYRFMKYSFPSLYEAFKESISTTTKEESETKQVDQ